MKNRYLFVVLIVLNLNAASMASSGLAPEEEWNMTYGGPFGVWAHSIQEIPDGGYIFVRDDKLVKLGGAKPAEPEQTPEPAITKIANKSGLPGFDALFTLCVMLILVYLHLMKKGS